MPAVTTQDGVSIAYAITGEAPPHLLFMHGWAGSGRYFDATIEHLDLSRLCAVTFDLRGHRESGPATDGYTLEQIAADTLTVADAAGAHEFVVLGFSMSAKFCQYLSLVAPDRIVGQILVAGCPAGEVPLPQELTDDWLSREGDPVADVAGRRGLHDTAGGARVARAVRPRRRDRRPRRARRHPEHGHRDVVHGPAGLDHDADARHRR